MRTPIPILLVAAFVAACAPEDRSGTVSAYASTYEEATRTNSVRITQLENLESLVALKGRDVEFRSGGGYYMGLGDMTVGRGRPFSLEYTFDANGVVQPAQMQDLYATSVYKSLDSVASLLREHGYTPRERIQVFMNPHAESLIAGDARSQLMDNAAYDFVNNVFLVLPNYLLSERPLLLNFGVLAHEFGHSVIHQILFADGFAAEQLTTEISAIHEGVADLIGLVASADPDFIRISLSIAERDLSVPLDYTEADYAELQDAEATQDPHRHGSFLARAIYESWPKDGTGRISRAGLSSLLDTTLAALQAFAAQNREGGFAGFANVWVRTVPASQRSTTCAVFQARLAPLLLTECGEVAP